jgi:hypothetical protein
MLQPEIASEDIGSISSKGFSKLTSWVSLFTSKYAKPMATATGGAVKGPVRRVPRVQPGQPNVPVFTYAEVAQHSTPDDAWVVIEGSVYEISGMAHPGGEVLFSYAGRDATEPFQALHKNQVGARLGRHKGHDTGYQQDLSWLSVVQLWCGGGAAYQCVHKPTAALRCPEPVGV